MKKQQDQSSRKAMNLFLILSLAGELPVQFRFRALEDAGRVGEKIVAKLSRPFELNAGTARIGASVDAAVYPDHEDTIDALIKRADVCMYEAKKKGQKT